MGGKLEPRHITLPLSYRYTLFVPGSTVQPKPLLVCLHGYGQSGRDSLAFGRRVREDWPVAALQAPHPHHKFGKGARGTGFGWVSDVEPAEDVENHHRFLLEVIERAHREGVTDAPRAFLFGFSQSVSLNYRFAAAHPERVRGVVAVAGAAPSDWSLEGEPLEMPVLHIAPTEDPAYPLEKAHAFRDVLTARAPRLTWHEEPGGHRVPRASYPVIRAWLDAAVLDTPPQIAES